MQFTQAGRLTNFLSLDLFVKLLHSLVNRGYTWLAETAGNLEVFKPGCMPEVAY